MADPISWWTTAGRDLLNVVVRGLPQRFLRRRWPVPRLLGALTIIADAQPCFVYIGSDRPSHDLESLNFHVINFSPLQLSLVGADLEVGLHSMTWIRVSKRFSTESPLAPFSRGGFTIQETLTEQQAQLIIREKEALTRIRVTGKVIVRTPFGEHRKDIHADVIASIIR